MSIPTTEYKFTEKDLKTLTQASAELRTATKEMEKVSAAALDTAQAHKRTVAEGGTALSSLRLGNPAGSVSDLSGPVTAADMESESQRAAGNRESAWGWVTETSSDAWDWAGDKSESLAWESIEGLKKFGEEAQNVSDDIKELGNGALEEFSKVMQTVSKGGKADFTAMTDSIIHDLERLAIKLAAGWVAELLGSYLSGMMGGGTGGATGSGGSTGGGSLPAGQYVAARGLAFDQSGVIAFAKGGVVNKPTLFAFADGVGLMGEAGPEAIMPLKRGTDGKLGVAASGSAQPAVNVVIENHSGQQVQQRQSTGSFGEKEIRVIVGQAVADQIYNGGPVRQALEGRYQIPKRM